MPRIFIGIRQLSFVGIFNDIATAVTSGVQIFTRQIANSFSLDSVINKISLFMRSLSHVFEFFVGLFITAPSVTAPTITGGGGFNILPLSLNIIYKDTWTIGLKYPITVEVFDVFNNSINIDRIEIAPISNINYSYNNVTKIGKGAYLQEFIIYENLTFVKFNIKAINGNSITAQQIEIQLIHQNFAQRVLELTANKVTKIYTSIYYLLRDNLITIVIILVSIIFFLLYYLRDYLKISK